MPLLHKRSVCRSRILRGYAIHDLGPTEVRRRFLAAASQGATISGLPSFAGPEQRTPFPLTASEPPRAAAAKTSQGDAGNYGAGTAAAAHHQEQAA